MNVVYLICGECGKEFEKNQVTHERAVLCGRTHFYCSIKCYQQNRPRRKKSLCSTKSIIYLICSECGKEFEKERKEYNRRIRLGVEKLYCSLSCSGINGNRVSPRGFAIDRSLSGRGKVWAPDDLSPFRWYMRRCKNRVNKKGITDLTEIYLKDLWAQQATICPLTGWKLQLPRWTNGWSKDEPFCPSSASLDRIDNTLGYVKGNVRFIAVMANYARNIFTDEEVIKFGKAVAEYNKSK